MSNLLLLGVGRAGAPATFPAITGTSARDWVSGTALTFDATLPSGNVGDLLMLFIGSPRVDGTLVEPTGWTELADYASDGSLTDGARLGVYYKVADNAETTLDPSTNTSQNVGMCVIRFSGAGTPQVSALAKGNDANPDPASLTPSGGSKKYKWLTAVAVSAPRSFSDDADNYTYEIEGTSNGIGVNTDNTNVNLARVRVCHRDLEAASDDPNTSTIAASARWVAATIAIPPA